MTSLLTELSKHCHVIDENWLGINFLPLTSNEVGASLVGINTKNNVDFTEKKFIYCVGLDSYAKLLTKVSANSFIVAQTAYADPLLKKVNLILPSTSFTEKEGTFVNLEGRVQKTASALIGPSLARDDLKITQTLFGNQIFEKLKFLNKPRPFSNQFDKLDPKKNFNIEKNKNSFTKKLFSDRVSSKKVYKTSFKPVLSNFFSSNILTQNSILLSKCALIFRKNYSNFI
jgi:NADH dehydrogenase (ubiquinone) Fe-S protein 1